MSARPEISIVSGFHDREAGVEASVGSVLRQERGDFELILFDDASRDGTAAALAAFDDPRIRLVLHERNLGFTRALLHAVGLARGRFLAIHGSGDVSDPARIGTEAAFLEAHPDVGMVDVVNDLVTPDGAVHPQPRRGAEATVATLLRETPFSHGSVMYRRDAYDRAGGYHPAFRYSQDRDLWLRMARTTRLVRLPEPLHRRTVHTDGATFSAAKGVPQAQHLALGDRLAHASDAERERLLARVTAEGIDAVVPVAGDAVQAILRRRLRKLAKVGRFEAIDELRAHLTPAGTPAARAEQAGILAYARFARRFDPSGAGLRAAATAWDRLRHGREEGRRDG